MNKKLTHKRINLTLHIMIVLLTIILVTGCSKSTEEAIIGKWEADDKVDHFIEFFHDKTFLINGSKLKNPLMHLKQLSGKWTMVDEKRIKADITVHGSTKTVILIFEDIEISGDTLTFTADGKEESMVRVK